VARLFARLEDLETGLAQVDIDGLRTEIIADMASIREVVNSLPLRLAQAEASLSSLEEARSAVGDVACLRQDLQQVQAAVEGRLTELKQVSEEVTSLRASQTHLESLQLEAAVAALQACQHSTADELQALQSQFEALPGSTDAEFLQRVPEALASLQESMCGIKNELLQVQQRLASGGVHQPFSTDASPESHGRQATDTYRTWRGELPMLPRHGAETERLSRAQQVVEVTKLAEELERARSASLQQTRLEVHLSETIAAVETQVSGVSLRMDEAFARLQEAELSLEAVSRGGVALRLRLEQLQGSVELRLTSFAADLADVAARCSTEPGLSLAAPAKGAALASRRDREKAEATVQELWGKLRKS